MIRIVLADDHPVVRTGLRAMLSGDPDLDVPCDHIRVCLQLWQLMSEKDRAEAAEAWP